jgi:hypothetical protein
VILAIERKPERKWEGSQLCKDQDTKRNVSASYVDLKHRINSN